MTKILSVSNHKGGVGKTTSSVNIGSGISQLGKQVLLIDLDPQANLTQSLGINDAEYNIYDILLGKKEVRPINVTKNLSIIPSCIDLSAAEIELSAETGREYILAEKISSIQKNYDYMLIDCPPSLGLLTINALAFSNDVIIPVQAQFLALQGLTKLIEIITKIKNRINKNLGDGCIIVTQFDKRKVLHRDVVESLEKNFPKKIFETKIRDNISLAEAPSAKMDIYRYDNNSNGAIDYSALVKEIIKKY